MKTSNANYIERRSEIENYFDRTAAKAWERLTSNAPVGRIRASVRAGRDEMRNTLLGWTPKAPVLLCAGAKDPVVLYAVNTAVSAADIKARGGNVTEVDVEKVPAFAPILSTFTPATYHGGVLVPCLTVVRDQLFAALR